MRIVAGIHRSRALKTPQGNSVRPTSDKVRGAVMNMLQSRGLIDGAQVIDGFCGTGALGLEALSQGAAHCFFIDKNKKTLDLCRENIAALKEEGRSQTLLSDLSKMKTKPGDVAPADLIFLDPPYGQGLAEMAMESLINNGWIAPAVVFVIEESHPISVPTTLEMIQQKSYGETVISLLAYKRPL